MRNLININSCNDNNNKVANLLKYNKLKTVLVLLTSSSTWGV